MLDNIFLLTSIQNNHLNIMEELYLSFIDSLEFAPTPSHYLTHPKLDELPIGFI